MQYIIKWQYAEKIIHIQKKKMILQCLQENLKLKVLVMSKNQLEYASAIGRAIDKKKEDVILVLHNIDGPGLRFVHFHDLLVK